MFMIWSLKTDGLCIQRTQLGFEPTTSKSLLEHERDAHLNHWAIRYRSHTNSYGRLNWPPPITRLTAHHASMHLTDCVAVWSSDLCPLGDVIYDATWTKIRDHWSTLTLKVLNFWKLASYCSVKPLWSGMGEVVPARTSPTLHPPSPPTVHQLSWLAL